MVRIRRILAMLATVVAFAIFLTATQVAVATPVDASFSLGFAQEPPPTDEPPPTSLPSTEIPPTEIPPTEVPPTATQPATVPPTQSAPTQTPATEIPPTEEPPTQGPAPTVAPAPPTPTEESRVSITVLPGTGGPATPASGTSSVALMLIAAAFLATSIAVRHPRRKNPARE